MSRHLYDIYKISQTEYGYRASHDNGLFSRICNHRASFTPVPGIAYSELTLNDLDFIPPVEFMEQYRLDYLEMQGSMIYGESPNFEELIEHLRNLFNN